MGRFGEEVDLEQGILRLFGPPESEIARSLEVLASEGIPLESLEITTCLRRGEIEIATVFEPAAAADYAAFVAGIRGRHPDVLYSEDGKTIDDQVAELLRDGQTVAVAESCTGGLMSSRLTELPGAGDYVLGGLVVYSNEAKMTLADVPEELIERHGAVSVEVAMALADGVREELGSEVGVGITGIAGPTGGTQEKPVGTVCFSVSTRDGRRFDRRLVLPGNRADVRDRSTTVGMHLIRRVLLGR